MSRCLLALLLIAGPALAGEPRPDPLAPDRAKALAALAPEDFHIRPPVLSFIERCRAAKSDTGGVCAPGPGVVATHADGRLALLVATEVGGCGEGGPPLVGRIAGPDLKPIADTPLPDPQQDADKAHAALWAWLAALPEQGFAPAGDLIVAAVEQLSGIRSHQPLVVLGAPMQSWLLEARDAEAYAIVRLMTPEKTWDHPLGRLAHHRATCAAEARAAGQCADATAPNLLQVALTRDGSALIVTSAMGDGTHCGTDRVTIDRWPLPAQARPAMAPRQASVKPAPGPGDTFAVITHAAVEIHDPVAGRQQTLPRPPGAVWSCAADPRAGGLWIRTDDPGGETRTLWFVDAEQSTAHAVVERIPAEVYDLIIEHGENARIGGHDRVELRVGVAVRLREKPVVEPEVGCEGDASWYCYPDGDESKGLVPEYETRRIAITKLKLEDPVWLATIARRGGDRPLWRSAATEKVELPRVTAVPEERCQAIPEWCGRAEPVAGTAYWRVVVDNDRGDFFYQSEQLFDPGTKMFFSPGDPTTRSPKPVAEGGGVAGMHVAPSGTAYMYGGRVLRFDGRAVELPKGARLCGWMGAPTRIGGPRD